MELSLPNTFNIRKSFQNVFYFFRQLIVITGCAVGSGSASPVLTATHHSYGSLA